MTRVLIVEDNLTLLENVVFELEMNDFEVLQAMDGNEAIKALKQAKELPDIIVSDIAMPDMNGFEFLETVRANQNWKDIPFIFLTAFDSQNAVQLGKDLGADDYLIKPFDPDDLIAAMRKKLSQNS